MFVKSVLGAARRISRTINGQKGGHMYIDNSMFRAGYLTRSVKAIMALCVGVYVLQLALPKGVDIHLVYWFGLSVEGIRSGWVWQFLTYTFLHGSFVHILMNMLGLFFLGPELERTMGTRTFTAMLAFCGILGGLGWLLLTYPYEGVCVGASGAIFGLIGAFAGLFPNRQLTLLVFFILPVTMPAWLLAVLFGLMQLAYLLNPGPSGIAYAAHLAGGIAGYIFVRVLYRRRGLSGAFSQAKITRENSPSQSEVNAILDKISTSGIHTLTPRERSILQEAGRRSR